MTNKPAGGSGSGTNSFWDEHSHVTKVVCIIAQIECYSTYGYYKKGILMIDALI